MGRLAKDYSKYKIEFFESDTFELRTFFRRKGYKRNGTLDKQTVGWSKEKRNRVKKIEQKALDRLAKKKAKDFEIDVEKLKKAKKTAVNILIGTLNNFIDPNTKTLKENVNVKDVKDILNTIKIELHEPIVVSKSHNTVVQEDLTPEEIAEIEEAREEDDD